MFRSNWRAYLSSNCIGASADNEIQFVVSRKDPAQQILAPYGYSVKKMDITKIAEITHNSRSDNNNDGCGRPKVVVAMGGGICVPFAYIAWLLRIPVVSPEQK